MVAWATSCAPERLFKLAHNIAPLQPDIMQIAIGPPGQFASLASALTPDSKNFAEPAQNTLSMRIRHDLMAAYRHSGPPRNRVPAINIWPHRYSANDTLNRFG
jgi:hypothetical protein